jgi:hypothetical protein
LFGINEGSNNWLVDRDAAWDWEPTFYRNHYAP